MSSESADSALVPVSEPKALSNATCDRTTWRIALGASFSYSLSYFWRYPIFILPADILTQPVLVVGGRDLDLQACFSIAFIIGFGCAKPFAAVVVSSPLFFHILLQNHPPMGGDDGGRRR